MQTRVERFLENRAGLDLDTTRSARIAAHVRDQLAEHSLDERRYLDVMESNSELGRSMFDELLATVLVHETFFYRFGAQLDALRDTILPEILESGVTELNLWSAACSQGAEPYTLAMIALSAAQRQGVEVEVNVLGTDICESFLVRARRATYGPEKLGELPESMKQQFLEKIDDRRWRVRDEVASRVEFTRSNLLSTPVRKGFHVICARNVLMYLRRDPMRKAVENLVGALSKQGHLLVGHSESLHGHSDLLAADRRFPVGIYRKPSSVPIAKPETLRVDPPARAPAPTEKKQVEQSAPEAVTDRIVLTGDYDADRSPEKLEFLKRSLGDIIDNLGRVIVDADGASSLDLSTARLIARAARLAESQGGRLTVLARRSSVRRWAQRHRLPLGNPVDEEEVATR